MIKCESFEDFSKGLEELKETAELHRPSYSWWYNVMMKIRKEAQKEEQSDVPVRPQ